MDIIQDYQALHRIPELDRELPKTTAYICSSLQAAGWQVTYPSKGAVAGFLDLGKSQTVAFRADMDALPLQEQTGLSYSSVHPGIMHACGHDGHTAVLLELARRFQKSLPPKNVLLLFQPAEETDGGAKALCSSGILEQHSVRSIYALHLWPGLPAGEIASKPGAIMARSSGVSARFSGKSAHVARAREGLDALQAAVRFCKAAQKYSSKNVLLKFGSFHSGTAPNCLADTATLSGTLRCFDTGRFCATQKSLRRAFDQICRKTGCSGELTFSGGYPALCNPAGLFRQVRKSLPFSMLKEPSFTAEDFSFFLQKYPGLYFFLGTGDTFPLHSARFCFDPHILISGADFFEQLAYI